MSESETSINFTEKPWGRDIEGEYVMNGISYRGKRSFGIALDALKVLLKKGSGGEVENVAYKVLDARKSGSELVYDIEVIEDGNRGMSVLKLYGPNKQKEYTALITKNKLCDAKFVSILSIKVIKPLIIKLLNGANKSAALNVDEKNIFCDKCNKSFQTVLDINDHMVKVHNIPKNEEKLSPAHKRMRKLSMEPMDVDSDELSENNIKKVCKNEELPMDLDITVCPSTHNANIKNIPDELKSFVTPGDVIYVVPGDGACATNCVAAKIFGDEAFGPLVNIKKNRFMARHWETRYETVTPCSKETPFVRKLNGNEVIFTNPKLLKDFLNKSDEAAYMWCDSEDLAVLADMYQVKFKIVKRFKDPSKKPLVFRIDPEVSMRQFAEIESGNIEEITLINENDDHFDLITSKECDLVKYGNLSKRYRINQWIKSISEVAENTEDVEKMKTEYVKCKESIKQLEAKYLECEKEVRKKTEENEKIVLELQEIKQLLKLKDEETVSKQIDSADSEDHSRQSSHLVEVQDKTRVRLIKCDKCNKDGIRENEIANHICKQHEEDKKCEEEFNCIDCDFQGNSSPQLSKHIRLKHTLTKKTESCIKCNICGEEFNHKSDLMSHRKHMHAEKVAPCRNEKSGKCPYVAEVCWWSHSKKEEKAEEKIRCFMCNEVFRAIPELMIHKKNNHVNIVKKCEGFLQNRCRFKSTSCWYIHEDELDDQQKVKAKENDESVFQKAPVIMKPPLAQK